MTREEKQKAIDAVERLNALKQFIGYDKDSEIVQATQKSLDMAIKALEAPPNDNWEGYSKRLWKSAYEYGKADAEQRWIPVSERLPDKNMNCFVTLENGVVKVLGYSTTQRTAYPKGFYYVEDGISWRQTQNPVVAWMPLPEPYKAESEEV